MGVGRGDRAYPGGIYRVRVGDGTVHAFATTLAPRACREVIVRSLHPAAPGLVHLHCDAQTDVTLVHTRSATDGPLGRDTMESLLAACAAEELVRDLATIP